MVKKIYLTWILTCVSVLIFFFNRFLSMNQGTEEAEQMIGAAFVSPQI